MTVFDTLNSLNVNEHTEQKDTGKAKLTYLSWPWAWAEVKKRYPDAHYEVIKNERGLPYFADERLGIMVYTTVTIDGVTHEMWLPVMDGNNLAMRFDQYEVATKYKTFTVKPATMFDVNKAVMRCLVKNLAMFGLGLYIYAGEDLPETESAEEPVKVEKKPELTPVESFSPGKAISGMCTRYGFSLKEFTKMRSGLVAAKIVPDVSSSEMTLETWNELEAAMIANFPDAFKDGESA